MLFGRLLHGSLAASPRDRRARLGWRFQSSCGAAALNRTSVQRSLTTRLRGAAARWIPLPSPMLQCKTIEWPEFTTENFEQPALPRLSIVGAWCLRDSRPVEREVHRFWAKYARCCMPWDVYGPLGL